MIPQPHPSHNVLRESFDRYSESVDSSFGRLQRLKPVLQMSETPACWRGPTLKPGEGNPEWLN